MAPVHTCESFGLAMQLLCASLWVAEFGVAVNFQCQYERVINLSLKLCTGICRTGAFLLYGKHRCHGLQPVLTM